MQQKKKIRFLVESALIAALYAGLTYLAGFLSLAYGPIQFRFSEALGILAALTPAAVPGLTVGCFLANILSFNILDMVFGTVATLAAAVIGYLVRKVTFRGIPWLTPLPAVVINAVVVGLEIAVFYTESDFTWLAFLISALTVGAGQLVACYVLGIPLYLLLRKNRIFSEKQNI